MTAPPGMLDDPVLNALAAYIIELRDDADVAALVGTRVRGQKPMGEQHDASGTLTYAGDARGPGEYVNFIVISRLSTPVHPRVPVVWGEYSVRCYGTTSAIANAVWGAVQKATHQVGPRVKSNGLGIYQSVIVGGGSDDEDPDTKQPVVTGVVQLIATAGVVT